MRQVNSGIADEVSLKMTVTVSDGGRSRPVAEREGQVAEEGCNKWSEGSAATNRPKCTCAQGQVSSVSAGGTSRSSHVDEEHKEDFFTADRTADGSYGGLGVYFSCRVVARMVEGCFGAG